MRVWSLWTWNNPDLLAELLCDGKPVATVTDEEVGQFLVEAANAWEQRPWAEKMQDKSVDEIREAMKATGVDA